MALVLLRHAPLALKDQKRYNGWSDLSIDRELFDHKLVESLKERAFDEIYSSDLRRCRETLELLFKNEKKIEFTKSLREVAFREEIEGKSFEEIEKLSSFDPNHLKSSKSWHNYIAKESPEAFNQRVKKFILSLPKNREILICSHGGTIGEILQIVGQREKLLDYLEYCEVKL